MPKRRPPPPEPDQHLTPTDVIANALTAAGLPPRPAGPGVRHFRLNSPEGEEALHDPRKREFGYVPLMVRPVVVWDEEISEAESSYPGTGATGKPHSQSQERRNEIEQVSAGMIFAWKPCFNPCRRS